MRYDCFLIEYIEEGRQADFLKKRLLHPFESTASFTNGAILTEI